MPSASSAGGAEDGEVASLTTRAPGVGGGSAPRSADPPGMRGSAGRGSDDALDEELDREQLLEAHRLALGDHLVAVLIEDGAGERREVARDDLGLLLLDHAPGLVVDRL